MFVKRRSKHKNASADEDADPLEAVCREIITKNGKIVDSKGRLPENLKKE